MNEAEKPEIPTAEQAPQTEEIKQAPPPAMDAGSGQRGRLKALDDEIERELEAAMGGMSAKDIYGEPAARKPKGPKGAPQGPRKGRVLRVHGQDVFVVVPGGRSEGVLPLIQFPEGAPAVGTEVEIHYEGFDAANGLQILSRKGAAVHVDWSSVAEGMIVEARVTATNKGGLSVEVNKIRGFMPISQIDLYRVDNPEQFVNQKLRCLVTEARPDERNLIVSRRALLEKEREENCEKLWKELAEGQVREGVVRSVRDFGAFVDLGGVDGLLHVSEMSWARVQDPNTVVQSGQTIKVVVLRLDKEKRKVSLGLKQLQQSPWDAAAMNYSVGSVVPGKVTRLMDFGAFVELEPGIEGLVHISELAPQRVWRVGDVVQEGQEVQVKVLKVDKQARKMSLSLKGAMPKQEVAAPKEEETEEETGPVKARKPRTTPLRGGIGDYETPFE